MQAPVALRHNPRPRTDDPPVDSSPENSPVPTELVNPECLYFRVPWMYTGTQQGVSKESHRLCIGGPVTVQPTVPSDGSGTWPEIPDYWFSDPDYCDCGAAPGY